MTGKNLALKSDCLRTWSKSLSGTIHKIAVLSSYYDVVNLQHEIQFSDFLSHSVTNTPLQYYKGSRGGGGNDSKQAVSSIKNLRILLADYLNNIFLLNQDVLENTESCHWINEISLKL